MKGKVSLKQRIGIVAVAALLMVSFSLASAPPVQAHIPEGWCPIEECWKHVGGGGAGATGAAGAAAADISIACVYRAMNAAIDELWDGKPPKRSDIKIISRLPTLGAKHAARCIVGVPQGEAPPWWTSSDPGEFETIPVEGTDEKNLTLENFEITIIRKRTGEEYIWKPGADVFPANYFKCRNREARGEEVKWWEEGECAGVTGKPLSKLEESVGKTLANEIHDKYAHHLDAHVIGKPDEKDTILYLATKLAESGDKDKYLPDLVELVAEADELISGFHDICHHKLVALAEETGKGGDLAHLLHDEIGHGMMGGIYKVSEALKDVEEAEGADAVKEKATKLLAAAKELKGPATEAHNHSTDPASVWTGQLPLKLRDGQEEIAIKYENLQRYHSEMVSGGKGEEGKEEVPIGGAIAFGVIVVGLVAAGVMRARRR